jgi:hypothetical protein
VACALAVAIACAAPPPRPLARVVSASPSGVVPPDDVTVEIAFSAPVDGAGIEDGRWIAICRREDLRDVSVQAETDAGLGANAPVVAARATLADGGLRIVVKPLAPLEPERAWAAVLSRRVRSADGRPVLDAEGRARTYALLFETGSAVDRSPPRARWVVPPHGPAPRNVAALRLAFDEPVEGALALAAGSAPARAVALAPDLLGLELGGPLAPGSLAVDISDVHDAAGNGALPPDPLPVSACPSTAAPATAAAVTATPGELSVRLETRLLGMGRLFAEVSAKPGDPACGVVPEAPRTLTFVGEVLACPGWDPCAPGATACPAALELKGLCPGQEIQVRLAAEDLAAHRGGFAAWTGIAALPPRPAPVLTEALAHPDAPGAAGEYVEVANVGTGPADLEGWALAKRGPSGAFTRCKLAGVTGGPVAPGGYALVVGGAYDGRYALPSGVAVYRCGTSALAGGLADDRPVALALEDAQGQVVSTLGIAEAAPRCPEASLERIHPTGPDASANLTCPGTRTPGACNHVTPAPECPARPW